MNTRVLLVEDDAALRRVFLRVLARAGIDAVGVNNGMCALAALAAGTFAAVVSDISMPGLSGTELLHAIRSRDLDLPVILMTGLPTRETANRARELGALDYLHKPVDLEHFCNVVRRAMHHGTRRLEAVGA